ncbi:hypothetical protein FisN_18Hu009 [Fistulifera solaris]|uniref:EGF-like domain-containing protein n=1 Tax=Fistulifera solaris TaxID=1519565 RepID=A0A1Z5JV63_FISSO|nr:hypothetical protein FisN_18Hu009 [Fistulifera solaris]|eukprot:GAX17809.1 hypothetical protein FisN_18Hu009 [Fistulifera solaris]
MRLSLAVTFLLLAAPIGAQNCLDLGPEVIDQGCTEEYPICVYRNGGQVVGGNTGHHCALCINSQQPNRFEQVFPDEGCDFDVPVCVGTRPLASNVEGTACALCVNSFPSTVDPNNVDDGCPPQRPVCVKDDGKNPAVRKPGTNCVAKCVDTSSQSKDKGCPVLYPSCVLEDGTDPGEGNAGEKCAICSPASCDDNDPCTDDYCEPEVGCFHIASSFCECGADAVDWECGGPLFPSCSSTRFCICDVDSEGAPFCWPVVNCENLTECSTNADCPENTRCATTCCSGPGNCFEECDDEESVGAFRVSAQEVLSGNTSAGFF